MSFKDKKRYKHPLRVNLKVKWFNEDELKTGK